jgi:hypothetical protein
MKRMLYTGAALAAALIANVASASLTINLQFADGSTAYQLTPNDIGSTIPVQVWGTITTSTPMSSSYHNGLQYVYYDVLSSLPNGPGTLVDGQVTSVALSQEFDANGSQQGVLEDANGDTVTDLGPLNANTSPGSLMTALPKARSGGAIWNDSDPSDPDIVVSADDRSVSFLLETLYFQVNSDEGIETDYSIVIPTLAQNYAPASWFEGVPVEQPGQGVGAQYTHSSPYYSGTSVQFLGDGTALPVPEPTSAAMLAIGSIAMLKRRKRTKA